MKKKLIFLFTMLQPAFNSILPGKKDSTDIVF